MCFIGFCACCWDTVLYACRLKTVDENITAFYNDGPLIDFCDHVTAFHFKAECTAECVMFFLSHELIMNLTINVA
jgi:hypothetical protein